MLYWLKQIREAPPGTVGNDALALGVLLGQGVSVLPGFVISSKACQVCLETVDWPESLFIDLPHSSLHFDAGNASQLQAIAQRIQREILVTEMTLDWEELAVAGRTLFSPTGDGTVGNGDVSSGGIPEGEVSEGGAVEGGGSEGEISASGSLWTPLLLLRPSLVLPNLPQLSPWQLDDVLGFQICEPTALSLERACKRLWANLFLGRSLFCWQRLGISFQQLRLAILVQPLWPTIASGYLVPEPESFQIQSTWGLGLALVQGDVLPDESWVRRSNGEVIQQRVGHKAIAHGLPPDLFPEATLLSPGRPNPHPSSYWLPQAQQKGCSLMPQTLDTLVTFGEKISTKLGTIMPFDGQVEWCLSGGSVPQLYVTRVCMSSVIRTLGDHSPLPIGSSLSPRTQSIPNSVTSSLPNLIPIPNPIPSPETLTCQGLSAAAGQRMAPAFVVVDPAIALENIPAQCILVSPTITPDWLPVLKRSAGIVTEQGGMTSHGAIIARELGIPAVVGVTGATQWIQPGELIFLDGDRGWVCRGQEGIPSSLVLPPSQPLSQSLPHVTESLEWATVTDQSFPLSTELWVSLSQPEAIARGSTLPVGALGLLRAEHLLMGLLEGQAPQYWVQTGQGSILVERLATALQEFVQGFAPRPVFYRTLDWRADDFPSLSSVMAASDSSSNSSDLSASNPLLGRHGTWCYAHDPTLFDLELQAVARIQNWGHTNLRLIVPFVRTVEEFQFCRQRVEQAELTREPSFQLWLMAEVPGIIWLLPELVRAGVQGIAIGSSDLSQLILAADRNDPVLSQTLNLSHPAVQRAIAQLIEQVRKLGIPCSLCGERLDRYPMVIEGLIQAGISAICTSMDAIEPTRQAIARVERRLLLDALRLQRQRDSENNDD